MGQKPISGSKPQTAPNFLCKEDVMAKFNVGSSGATTKTVNLAGGEAFISSPKLEFVSHLLTSFVADQFYRKQEDGIARLRTLIKVDQ
jgi:hypothetical protein